MKIVALETATEACSVSLWIDGEGHERFKVARNQHSDLLLPMVEQVLAEADIRINQCDAVAFGEGPGSFTGLRIGCGVAQGLAFAVDLPVIPVCSLQAQAYRYFPANVLSAFDARMEQIYWRAFNLTAGDLLDELPGPARLCAPGQLQLPVDGDWLAIGSGCDRYRDVLQKTLSAHRVEFVPQCYPHALDVGRIAGAKYERGQWVDAGAASPCYVRNDVTR